MGAEPVPRCRAPHQPDSCSCCCRPQPAPSPPVPPWTSRLRCPCPCPSSRGPAPPPQSPPPAPSRGFIASSRQSPCEPRCPALRSAPGSPALSIVLMFLIHSSSPCCSSSGFDTVPPWIYSPWGGLKVSSGGSLGGGRGHAVPVGWPFVPTVSPGVRSRWSCAGAASAGAGATGCLESCAGVGKVPAHFNFQLNLC